MLLPQILPMMAAMPELHMALNRQQARYIIISAKGGRVAFIRHTAVLIRIIKIKTPIKSKGFTEVDGG
jgi:hypothetical protein